MIAQVKSNAENKMKKTLENLKSELSKIRTGKAQTSMLDGIKVNYYGNLSPLNQVAAISCPDPKSFLIAPWEVSTLKEIETAIIKSDIGMTPMSDGKVVRLKLPDLTEQRRKELVKHMGKVIEDARVAIRMIRRDANDEVKKAEKEKKISEDDRKKSEAEVQKLTDQFVQNIDKMSQDKEKEIMTI